MSNQIKRSGDDSTFLTHPNALTGLTCLVVGTLITIGLSGGSNVSTELYKMAIGLDISLQGHYASEVSLLLLVGIWCVTALVFLFRRGYARLFVLVAGGIGAVLSLTTSRTLKALLTNTRPCNTYEVYDIVALCPPPDDWSFPSNHTAIGAALATTLIAAHRILLWSAAPLAIIAGVSRAVAGHHYPHDVIAGGIVGFCVTFAVLTISFWAWSQWQNRQHSALSATQ